jgi:hypothetical protein
MKDLVSQVKIKLYIVFQYMSYNLIIFFYFLLLPLSLFSQQNRAGFFMSQAYSDEQFSGKQTTFELGIMADTRFPLNPKLLGDSLITLTTIRLNMTMNLREKEGKDKYIYLTPENNLYGDLLIAYPVKWAVDPFVSVNFTSQPLPSFRDGGVGNIQTGSFRDPITTSQSFGLAYRLNFTGFNSNMITRLGATARQIRASNFTATTDDFTTPLIKENYKPDYGVSIKNELRYQIDSTSLLTSNFDLFRSSREKNNLAIKLTNDLQSVFLKYLTILVKLDLIYDEQVSKRVQIRQSIRFGILTNF